ncbi:MAG: helicase [Deltaproteobacteria bacterium]|nr:MAG: helicase [Deltaproteobacteria bacterium]
MIDLPPTPAPGQVVRVRQRRWLVEQVDTPSYTRHSPLVRLSCLEDGSTGEAAEVLWHHELDAQIEPETPRLSAPGGQIDDPVLFGAYLNAIRWNAVTSTDRRLLQAPFRAGIDLKEYQLEPLRKALELPRVNLFIADDVGLGKTIEAGLVLQELLLRQRIDRVLVVCPPAVTVQWQEELEQRFGLRFALYDRDYVTARRRERGFSINPWTTHSRFIVSYARLRGTRKRHSNQHLELLLSALKSWGGRSLLILDECHQVAPSTGSLYPADSRTTRAIRQIAGHFEHRLFLSATPHNGHSTSFASLLHLLDPQRFTSGVPIASAKELAPIMVRRLKRHLRETVGGLPRRHLVDHTLDVPQDAPEIQLAHLLGRYDTLYRACLRDLPKKERNARALVVVNLHKRLLSSVEAFHHTLRAHEKGARKHLTSAPRGLGAPDPDAELTEDQRDAEEEAFVERASFDPGPEALALLDEMLTLAARHAAKPDARARELAAWINDNLCPGGTWGPRRVVVFTEYQHTLNWLRRVLPGLLYAETHERISVYTGQIGETKREKLKTAFNTNPTTHPLRILLATDAAREGINLQAHCTDLFHFDLPWNPSRIEQRNGRIDRVLQPSHDVWCHYFHLPARPEDRVLAYLVDKMHRIREELGSLSEVISAKLADALQGGIRQIDEAEIDALTTPDAQAERARMELEGEGADQLQGDLDVLTRQLERSRRAVAYRPEHLQALVDLGLRLVSNTGEGLIPVEPPSDPPRFALPPLDDSWQAILDPMREKVTERGRFDPPPPLRPVAFRAAHRLDADTVQLHLGHPLVKRLLARFRAQGFAAHDLTRVTALLNPHGRTRRVILFGRLSLFGHGATRLHEDLIALAAEVTTTGLSVFKDTGRDTTIAWVDEALAHDPRPLRDDRERRRISQRVDSDFAALWPALKATAEAARAEAVVKLIERGERESRDMIELLARQRASLQERMQEQPQLDLAFEQASVEERMQYQRDRRVWAERLDNLDTEVREEPARIRRSYEVVLDRFEPVGLTYLWVGG